MPGTANPGCYRFTVSTVPNQGMDVFVYDTGINAIQVWTRISLGRASFLSSALAFHFRPGLERFPGMGIILFIFLDLAERTIVCCLWFE